MLAKSADQRSVLGTRDLDAVMLKGRLGGIEHGIVCAIYGAIAVA